jgi:hypothetical protein
MMQSYHFVLWDYWQLMDGQRIDRILAEHDRLDEAYLTHYAVNHPDGLKQRDQAFRARHVYQTPSMVVLTRADQLEHDLRELEAFNDRVRRRQRRAEVLH